jgi:predicted membrane protein
MSNRNSVLSPQLVVGLTIIVFGILFLMHNFGWIEGRQYWRYWPLILVFLGLSMLLQPAGSGGRGTGLVMGIAGGMLLLYTLGYTTIAIWQFWPVILVLIGIGIVWQVLRGPRPPVDLGDDLRASAFLGGTKLNSSSKAFRGGEATAILGGCEIDLTGAEIEDTSAVLNCFAFMGGVDLRVPDEWAVSIQGTPILGGFEDKTRRPRGDAQKRLVVKGFAILGGITVKN